MRAFRRTEDSWILCTFEREDWTRLYLAHQSMALGIIEWSLSGQELLSIPPPSNHGWILLLEMDI